MEITTKDELEAAITRLKIKKEQQQAELGVHFRETYESFKPANILKNTISGFTHSGDARSTLLKAVGGIGSGLLTKGLLGSRASSVVGSVIGKVVKAGATNAFYNNAGKLKAYGTAIYHNLFKKSN